MALTKASLDQVYIWCGHADTLGTCLFDSNKKVVIEWILWRYQTKLR